jgi:hypothetical protein
VRWINDQFAPVAAECGFNTDDKVSHVLGFSAGNAKDLKTRNLRSRPRSPRINVATSKSVLSPNSSSRVSKPRRTKSDQCRGARSLRSRVPESTIIKHAVEASKPSGRSTRLDKPHASNIAQVLRTSILGPATASRVTKFTSTPRWTKGDIIQGRRPPQRKQAITKKVVRKHITSVETTTYADPNG